MTMRRTLQASRLYVLKLTNFVTVPASVLAGMAVLSYGVAAVVAATAGEVNVMTGGIQAPLWALFGCTLSVAAGLYPFSFAMGLGRRTYFLGTVVFFGAFSLAFALICALLGFLERVTDGFGSHGRFFVAPIGPEGAGAEQFVAFFGLTALMLTTAYWFACCYKRWKGKGLLVAGAAVVVVAVALSAAATVLSWWQAIWTYLIGLSAVEFGAWLTALAVIAMTTAWPILRRAAP
jgi:hypothetical protein